MSTVPAEAPEPHPVRLVVTDDDLARSRLTVFFRLFLALPHYIWLSFWTLGAVVAAFASWIATLATGRSPELLHRFLSAYVRYTIHVSAYLFLGANPFPGFAGDPGTYPVDVEIDGPVRQNRWSAAFRLVLGIPALLLSGVLVGGFSGQRSSGYGLFGGGLAASVAFFAWFACLARSRMPSGFRDVLLYVLRYTAQTDAYVFLLTPRYPDSDPGPPAVSIEVPPRAVRARIDDDLRRSRLVVFFRFLLALPHLVWLTLWGVTVVVAAFVSWVATVATGRNPELLHRFVSAYVRYWAHVNAFVYLVANPFPGFTGTPRYPLAAEIDPPKRQRRWPAGFRLLLAVPPLAVASGFGSALFLVGVFGWFYALATGRMARGLRNLGVYALRYSVETYAYLLLLTERYPFSGRLVEEPPAAAPPAPLDALR